MAAFARSEASLLSPAPLSVQDAVAFSAGGDGGRRSPEHPTRTRRGGSQRSPNNRDLPSRALINRLSVSGSVNVRFVPKATEVLRCRELTRCAKS
jgi:hypothetical protein